MLWGNRGSLLWVLSLLNKKNLRTNSEGSSRTILSEFERKTTGQASFRISEAARRREMAEKEVGGREGRERRGRERERRESKPCLLS